MMGKSNVNWILFPRNRKTLGIHNKVIDVFIFNDERIDSKTHGLSSNEVLEILRSKLESIGFEVEKGKKKNQKITVPVLYGENGVAEKYFDADAYSAKYKTVIEVEAGRAYTNNQFLKDIFQACAMDNTETLILGVRNLYNGSKDYEKIKTFLETMYVSNKFNLPLEYILLIGY
jgi:hypothetical protein